VLDTTGVDYPLINRQNVGEGCEREDLRLRPRLLKRGRRARCSLTSQRVAGKAVLGGAYTVTGLATTWASSSHTLGVEEKERGQEAYLQTVRIGDGFSRLSTAKKGRYLTGYLTTCPFFQLFKRHRDEPRLSVYASSVEHLGFSTAGT
jgi:hypothetical protein